MKIKPTGRRGRQPTFQAKVGTMPGSIIIVRRVRDFHVDQRIHFAETQELEGCAVGMPPVWRTGIIWKIEGDRLFISRL